MNTQAALEHRLLEILARAGATPAATLFGQVDEWVTEIAGHPLLLNPVERRWYWLDRLHQQWRDSGFGVGQALFVQLDRRLAAKRVPDATSAIEQWAICIVHGKPIGPLPQVVLRERITQGQIPPDSLTWTADATQWRPAAQVVGGSSHVPPSPRRRRTVLLTIMAGALFVVLGAGTIWLAMREPVAAPAALYEQSMALIAAGQQDQGLQLCASAAQLGSADAQYYLGKMHMDRSGRYDAVAPFEDFASGTEWLQQAARQGHAGAQQELSQRQIDW